MSFEERVDHAYPFFSFGVSHFREFLWVMVPVSVFDGGVRLGGVGPPQFLELSLELKDYSFFHLWARQLVTR